MMTKRRRKRSRKPSGSRRPVVPGPWQTTGETLEDPGAGFMEVAMVALDVPDAPLALQGHAAQMLWFREVAPGEPCPCGSGQTFGDCHRDSRRVPLLCRDIGAETYGEIVACETTFPVHDDEAVARSLKAAPELRLTQDIPGRVFWQFVGQPPLETPVGGMVFATVELNPGRLYFVTLSQQRNEMIILALVSRASDALGVPMTQQSEVVSQYRRMIKQR
ncbi:MAG: SEC-C domain-containing protein [Anaerolineae bacterium]|nr:SEC-C domain-containing protein [Anaerolineae bacterium]